MHVGDLASFSVSSSMPSMLASVFDTYHWKVLTRVPDITSTFKIERERVRCGACPQNLFDQEMRSILRCQQMSALMSLSEASHKVSTPSQRRLGFSSHNNRKGVIWGKLQTTAWCEILCRNLIIIFLCRNFGGGSGDTLSFTMEYD